VAFRKARALIDFGARIRALAPEASQEFRSLARDGFVSLDSRAYGGPEDLAGAVLVIAATDRRELNARIARDAEAAGIPVNVADDPGLCTFFFPALVKRGELVAGISSSGSCPRLTARLREELEKSWPQSLGESLERLKEERRRIREPEAAEVAAAAAAGVLGARRDAAETISLLDPIISQLLAEGRFGAENSR
jgi:siroheme synthase-like protein